MNCNTINLLIVSRCSFQVGLDTHDTLLRAQMVTAKHLIHDVQFHALFADTMQGWDLGSVMRVLRVRTG